MKRFGSIFLGLLIALGGLACIVIGLVGAYGDAARATRSPRRGRRRSPSGSCCWKSGWRRSGLPAATGMAASCTRPTCHRGGSARYSSPPRSWAVGWPCRSSNGVLFPLATVAVFAPIAAAGPRGCRRLACDRVGRGSSWPSRGGHWSRRCWRSPSSSSSAALIGAVVAVAVGVSSSGQQNIQLLTDTWTYRLQGRDLSDPNGRAAPVRAATAGGPGGGRGGAGLRGTGQRGTRQIWGGAICRRRATRRREPDPRTSTLAIFLIGLASGLGFAATRNMFYVAQAQEGGMVAHGTRARGGARVMHGTAAACSRPRLGAAGAATAQLGLAAGRTRRAGAARRLESLAGLVILGGAFAGAQTTTPTASSMILIAAVAAMGGLLILGLRDLAATTPPAWPAKSRK